MPARHASGFSAVAVNAVIAMEHFAIYTVKSSANLSGLQKKPAPARTTRKGGAPMNSLLSLCRVCKELKLELGSLHLLVALAEWPLVVGRCMGDLARQVGVKGANIRCLADRLEERGLVVTKRALYDRRRVYCSLTQKGEALLTKVQHVINEDKCYER